MEKRVIKFRCWEVNKHLGGRMSEPFTVFDIHNCASGLGTYGDQYTLMQFTGLEDWSEPMQEICESDIVLCDGKQRTIKWANGKFWFVAEFSNQYEDISEMFGKYYGKVKKIGNIYQNPELLPTP